MSQSSDLAQKLAKIVADYLKKYPEEKAELSTLIKQLEDGDSIFKRKNYTGHLTGSAIIFNPSKDKVLIIHHPSFDRWLQPGGHFDPGEDGPWQTAKREAIEETGAKIKAQLGDPYAPIDISSHLIPTVPPLNEPEHFHHDFRYVFLAESEELVFDDIVIKEAKWMYFDEVQEESVKTALDKARELMKS